MKQKTAYIPVVAPGTDLKFRVTVTKENFSLDDNQFSIVIKNRWGRVVASVMKGDCYKDSEGRWYFNVENIQDGEHYAVFIGAIADTDYGKQQRLWHDRLILYVGQDGCCVEKLPILQPDDCPVSYEQVWTANIGGDEYLADRDGHFVYTSDDQRISFIDRTSADGKVRMQMTGEEFLKLIEGKAPNSAIDTIPELMDAMQGISDDTTVKEEIEDQVEEDTPGRVTPEDLAHFEI